MTPLRQRDSPHSFLDLQFTINRTALRLLSFSAFILSVRGLTHFLPYL